MSLEYLNLTSTVRAHMMEELLRDIEDGSLYESRRLTDDGQQNWSCLLSEAIREHDDEWLAEQLRANDYLNQFTHTVRGPRRMPSNAPDTLAEGEFNRYYIRGVCLEAQQKSCLVQIYRARTSSMPRRQSQALIGTTQNPTEILQDLRDNPGSGTMLGVPAGPNSGISVTLLDGV